MSPRCFHLGHLIECPKHHWPYRPGNSCVSCDREARAIIREEQKARQEVVSAEAAAKPAGKTKKFIAKLKPKHGKEEKDDKDKKGENKATKQKDKHKKPNA